MKLIDHASKWGNLYRHRYYVNGKRVSESVFELTFAGFFNVCSCITTQESDATWYRTTYTFKGV